MSFKWLGVSKEPCAVHWTPYGTRRGGKKAPAVVFTARKLQYSIARMRTYVLLWLCVGGFLLHRYAPLASYPSLTRRGLKARHRVFAPYHRTTLLSRQNFVDSLGEKTSLFPPQKAGLRCTNALSLNRSSGNPERRESVSPIQQRRQLLQGAGASRQQPGASGGSSASSGSTLTPSPRAAPAALLQAGTSTAASPEKLQDSPQSTEEGKTSLIS